jgi:hypothetical protein
MQVLDWLLESEPYVQYATRINIFRQSKTELEQLRADILLDVRINAFLKDIVNFNSILVTNHKNPELPIHKLIFLLNTGLNSEVPEIRSAINLIINNKDELGMYKSMTNVPKHFGGSGEDILSWALCDAPLMLYALVNAGVSYEEHFKPGVEYIISLLRDNGFPCVVSKELGRFRGPGKKEDCCPYATLIILRLLSVLPQYTDSKVAEYNIDVLLSLWEHSKEKHPYLFYMGTDFRKLKAPTIWYDIVSVADCLSRFKLARNDTRFKDMVDIIERKADVNYRFTPESIYLKFKDWDFGQKKQPSPWLTYLCLTILERCERFSFI